VTKVISGLWRSPHKPAVFAACTLLALVALAAPANAGTYGSNGVFGVDPAQGDGWVTAHIPPGRYRVDQAPSMFPYQSAPGFWLRCNSYLCAPNYPGNIIASGEAIRDVPTFMDVLPSDVAVSLNNVTLTTAG
jgi:hypothetical protein